MKKSLIYAITFIMCCFLLCSCESAKEELILIRKPINAEDADAKGNAESIEDTEIKETAENTKNAGNSKTTETIYRTKAVSLNREYSTAEIVGDIIYGGAISNSSPVVTMQDKNTGEIINEITVPISGTALEIQSLTSDNDGNVYLIIYNYTGNSTAMWRIDTAGALHEMNDIMLEDTQNAQSQAIKEVIAGPEGNIYLWCEMGIPASEADNLPYEVDENVYVMVDRIYVKDSELNTLFYIQVPAVGGTKLNCFYVSKKEGKPVAVISDDEGVYVRKIDLQKKAFSDEAKQIEGLARDEMEIMAVTENEFLFSRNGTLYSYSPDSKKADSILNFATYGISWQDIVYMKGDRSSIEVIDNREGTSGYINLLEGEVNKTVVIVGMLQFTQDIEKAVVDFNRSNPDIMVNVKTYYQEGEDFEQSIEKLKLDMVTGDAPDIMEVSMIDYEILADKGIFADLYSFMQKEDKLNQDQILPSVREAYEINGQLFNISPGFQLYTIWGNKNKLGNRSGVTLNELMQVLEKNGKTIDAVDGFSADEPVLTTLCAFGMEEFINWETGECDFTNDYFKDLLQFAGGYSGGYMQDSVSKGIEEGDILMSVGVISSVADYQIQSKLYGGSLTFIGYPTADGSGTAIGYRGGQLAISNYSAQKEAAWEFVKYYIQNGYDNRGFPVLKDQFDKAMEKAQQKDMATEDGITYELPKGYFSDGKYYFEVFAASSDDVETIRNLAASAGNRHKYNTDILAIINEEAGAYFANRKSVDETAEIIQNRVKLYLNEQIG